MFNSAGTEIKSLGRIIKINRFELLTNRKRAVTFLHVQMLKFIASFPSTFLSFTPYPTEHVIMALKLAPSPSVARRAPSSGRKGTQERFRTKSIRIVGSRRNLHQFKYLAPSTTRKVLPFARRRCLSLLKFAGRRKKNPVRPIRGTNLIEFYVPSC